MSGNGETSPLSNIVEVAVGATHTCALNSAGNIYCWGYGGDGALANNNIDFIHDVDYPTLARGRR